MATALALRHPWEGGKARAEQGLTALLRGGPEWETLRLVTARFCLGAGTPHTEGCVTRPALVLCSQLILG